MRWGITMSRTHHIRSSCKMWWRMWSLLKPTNREEGVQPRITSCVCWPSARRLKGTRPALEEMETWQRSRSYRRSSFRSSRPSASLKGFWSDKVTMSRLPMKVPDIPRKKDVMRATVHSKTSQLQWPKLKEEQVATCTTLTTGTFP